MMSHGHIEPASDLDAVLRWVEHEMFRIGTITTDETVKGRLVVVATRIAELRFAIDQPKAGDKRTDLRSATISATYLWVGDERHECAICDLSRGGALVRCDVELIAGTEAALVVPSAGCISATVIGSSVRGIHLAFSPVSPETEIALIQAMQSSY